MLTTVRIYWSQLNIIIGADEWQHWVYLPSALEDERTFPSLWETVRSALKGWPGIGIVSTIPSLCTSGKILFNRAAAASA